MKVFVYLVLFFGCMPLFSAENIDVIDLEESQATEYLNDQVEIKSQDVDQEIDQVSELLEKNIPSSSEIVGWEEESPEIIILKNENKKIDYSNLRSIQFTDSMAIVQKSILDKSHRLQWNLSGGLVTTETFYRTFGLLVDATFHFNEKYGIKVFNYLFDSIERDEINDLRQTQRLNVENLVHLKNYYGIAAYWSPIYGKMTLFNEKIYQYETFLSIGTGSVKTKVKEGSTSGHIGIGSLFTLSDSTALRFDLNWIFYRTINVNAVEQDANSIVLTVGYSYFSFEGNLKK